MPEEAKQAILPGDEFAKIPHQPPNQRIVVRGSDGRFQNALISNDGEKLHFHYQDGKEIGQKRPLDLQNLVGIYRQLESSIPEELQESLRRFNIRSGKRNARRKKGS